MLNLRKTAYKECLVLCLQKLILKTHKQELRQETTSNGFSRLGFKQPTESKPTETKIKTPNTNAKNDWDFRNR